MRNRMLLALSAWWVSVAPMFAQTPPPPPNPPPPAPYPFAENVGPSGLPTAPVIVETGRAGYVEPYKVWMRAEFLLWWVKNTPLPVPLVESIDANNNTQVLIGNSDRSLGVFSGFRFGLGAWFDSENNIGMDFDVFSLDRQSKRFFAGSDGNGNPQIALPFFNQTPGFTGEFVLPLSNPGVSAGNVIVTSNLQLWGTDINAAFCILRMRGFEFTALAGFRYADLQENLRIDSLTTDLNTGVATNLVDNFNTHNQFYGGQIGARISWQGDRLALDAIGKVALGANHEIVDVSGFTSQFGPNSLNGTTNSGFFAQGTNSGRFNANQLAIIPTLELKMSYMLSPRWRLYLGYDFMYWNQVVRPGSQIDRNLNLTQGALGNGTLTGAPLPTPLFNRTDFWAQGVNFGFEFRF